MFLSIFNISLADGAKKCNGKFLNDNYLEYTFKDRQITVLGWTHLNEGEQAKLIDALKVTSGFVKDLNCQAAKGVLEKFLESSKESLKQSNHVVTSLEVIQEKRQFATIGRELSPEEWGEFFDESKNEHRVDRLLNSLNEKCNNLRALNDAILRIWDPSYYFAKFSKGKIKITPLENQQLKVASRKGVSEETMNFDPDKEVLTPKAKSLIEALQVGIRKGQVPNESEIAKIIAAESNAKQKLKLRRVFSDLKQILNLVDKRNSAIVRKAVAEQNDMVIVVGNFHVKGLASTLDKACQPESKIRPIEESSNIPISIEEKLSNRPVAR